MAQAFRTQNLRLLASILDANDNELIKSPSLVTSAVNELTISNAATTISPSISATGDDANISLNLIPKGTGNILINGKAISLANSFTTAGNFSLSFTTNGNTSLTLPTTGILATTNDIPTVNNATLTLAGSGGVSVSATPTFTANASTNKEITDTLAEKDTRDMSRAQLIKGSFRMLTLKLGQANIPMIVTNHTYESMSLYGGKQMSGGSGLQYASSTIVYLSKSKEKDGTEVIGNIIRAKTQKSRLSKENKQVEIRLFYDERGLDKYYGLLELGEIGGMWKNVAGRYEMDGKKIYGKDILKDVDKYFTPEVMKSLDEVAQKEFSYG